MTKVTVSNFYDNRVLEMAENRLKINARRVFSERVKHSY